MPTSRIATISSEVATGRRMKMRDGFIAAFDWRAGSPARGPQVVPVGLAGGLPSPGSAGLPPGPEPAPAPAPRRVGPSRASPGLRHAGVCLAEASLGAVAQAVAAVGDHEVAGLQPWATATRSPSPRRA